MNVLLVSRCSKRALVETRRVLDQFAERRGDQTWQTPITEIGLDTLRRMLKKTARRNTSVACHWIRGRDHSELLWIVGDASRFNSLGAAPTDTTEQDILRRNDESNWSSALTVTLLAVLAALFHDFGKASRAFEQKLRANRPVADAFRHEWVSLRLFEAFVGDDPDRVWLERLKECDEKATVLCLERYRRDDRQPVGAPFRVAHLPPIALAVGWLIVAHHRLPAPPRGVPFNARGLQYLLAPLLPSWNDARPDSCEEEMAKCWEFPLGLPFSSSDWRGRARKCAQALLDAPGLIEGAGRILDDAWMMHVARLALMLADHHYSSLESQPRYGDPDYPLAANTVRGTGAVNQRLDEHLAGVASHARRVMRALPRLEKSLPRIARCKGFQRRAQNERFRWQDKAYDLSRSLREATSRQGFFGVNMASTGCGKTLANGRILYALADPNRGARFTVALGLRTLTLQTGTAYRERLGLGEDDLAVLVGGAAVRELFALAQRDQDTVQAGSESSQSLLPDDSYVHFEGSIDDGPLKQWLATNSDSMKLVQAPVLVCTIDHLIPATEGLRGGRQIAPILRLLTSDLVLDEPDDFDLGDLPALSRLVHWAGVFGSRVLISSATLPPSLVEALFEAYRTGRAIYQENCGESGRPVSISCAWFDEFGATAHNAASRNELRSEHDTFVVERLGRLRREESRRSSKVVGLASSAQNREAACKQFAQDLPCWMTELHGQHHTVDPATGSRVSFGVVRMANIEPLIATATALYAQGAPPGWRFHLCVYHSRHPLLMRSAIERQLDATLRRTDPQAVFKHAGVRRALEGSAEPDRVFVVLASPVEEVGRDHDYDWAVVEPSSMRSIVQLAGRVRRHRPGPCSSPNVYLLDQNIKGLAGVKPAFCRPGFESAEFPLRSHALTDLLSQEQLATLDAGPRIHERLSPQPQDNLVDLEHMRLRRLMLGEGTNKTDYAVPHWWTTRAALTGVLQRSQPFRACAEEEASYALVPNEQDFATLDFYCCDGWTRQGNLCREALLEKGPRIETWGPGSFQEELEWLADQLDMELRHCARRFGTVQLKPEPQGWTYHPSLGFRKQR